MASPATAAEVFSFVEKALLVPLGTAAAGIVAEILRGQLSKGRAEANLSRLEGIKKVLADDALGLSGADKRALKEEAALIAESLQVLRRRRMALARTATRVLHWEQQPLARRLLTLPQPRNTTGWLATGLCLVFLYLAGVAVAALNAVISVVPGQDLPAFLGVLVATIGLPLFLAITARARAYQLAEARMSSQRGQRRAPLLRLLTVPRPRSWPELWNSAVWLVSSAWLLVWGIPLAISLIQGQWQRVWDLELALTGETLLLLPGAILIAVFTATALSLRNRAIDAAKEVIHRSQP